MIGQVVDIEAVLQINPFRYRQQFYERNVRALLPGLPKDVALAAAGNEVGLESVACGNGPAQSARSQNGNIEARGLQRRESGIVADRAGDRVLRGAARS